MLKNFYLIVLFLFIISYCNAQQITLSQQGKPTSIRGLSVVDDNIAWLSGSKGYVANTADGGKTWNWQKVKDFEKSDFRDIEAFSDKEAVIMSSGTPALLLKTVDGGVNWKISYQNQDTTCFLDAMDFDSPKHGFVMGDPIDNKFFMMETNDGGNTWFKYNGPDAVKNQAAFAASGTCLRLGKLPIIVTGGASAEIISSKNNKWDHKTLPLLQGQSARGAFSVAISKNNLVVVGGDYQKDKKSDSTACYSVNGGSLWHLAQAFPAGYQSCVEYLKPETLLATGTSGSNISIDNGKNWKKIDSDSYNVCRKAKHGNLVILAGDKGKIGIFKF